MTRRGMYKSKSAQRYLTYKNDIAWQIKAHKVQPTLAACGVKMTFYMPIPQSWSEKKKREYIGKMHTNKPDLDNIVKGLWDSANGLIWMDDRQVMRMEAEKVYSDKPGIEIQVQEYF